MMDKHLWYLLISKMIAVCFIIPTHAQEDSDIISSAINKNATLEVKISGVRKAEGIMLVCIQSNPEKFLDELLIWRELAYTFCFYRRDHGGKIGRDFNPTEGFRTRYICGKCLS